MKSLLFLAITSLGMLLSFTYTFAQTPCENGFAGPFPCLGFDLQDQLTESELGTTVVNDSWGWTDDTTGIEYAIIGLNNGTAFIDISNPTEVILLGTLPTHTTSNLWRDVKVYQNYAFIVSEAPGHGMQVFDLTRLRSVTSIPEVFTEDAHYDGFGNAHNIVINEESAFAYGVGTSTFLGGPHFIDISDPLNPTAAGGYEENNYSHDAQVVTYSGPDPDYAGREILIGSNENIVALVDITDKSNPVEISTITYPSIGFTHQGWFTEDQRYFLLGDETDEIGFGFNTRTIIFDFTDLDNPELSFEYEGPTQATDHNGYVLGDLFYLANYNAGMRLINLSTIANNDIAEIGYFDTVPSNDAVGTTVGINGGIWNVYPFFESGNIVLSGGGGFFLIKANNNLSVSENELVSNEITIYPNPAKDILHLSATTNIGTITVYSILGEVILTKDISNSGDIDISNIASGMYLLKSQSHTQRLIIR